MPSSHASGSASLTPGTPSTLSTITTPGFYRLVVDGTPLANPDEVLYAIVEMKVSSGGTTRSTSPFVIARGGGHPVQGTDWFECLHELVFKLLQEGGTGRSITWEVPKF